MASKSELLIINLMIIIITLSNSTIANDLCPGNCNCEDEYLRASCANADLDIVPIQLNPEIRHIDLSYNRITTLHLAFGFYDSLESLDLSYNIIHTIGVDNFSLQQRLITLNLSNNLIRNIAKNGLNGLNNLVNINLSNNNISELNYQSLHHCNELKIFNISGNTLTSLPIGLFNNNNKIINLDLSRNSLLDMPTSNLLSLKNLKYLNLSDNLIQSITRNSIPILSSLITLNLSNNVLRFIDDNSFDYLISLKNLSLDGNNITNLPTIALSKLNVLSKLILSKNPISKLDKLSFRNLFELKYLDLRDCNIRWIDNQAFSDNVHLIEIKLDGNHELTILPPRMLFNLHNLKIVTLRNCNLATIEPTNLPVDNLNQLQIGGNPIVCNCSVHWLWNVINTYEKRNNTKNTNINNNLIIDSHDIICYDNEFMGKKLSTLSDNSLKCRMSTFWMLITAACCFITITLVLLLSIYITRNKRQKRPSYTPPINRPELLVYVGTNNHNVNPKKTSRLIEKTNDDLYDLPSVKNETYYESPYCHRNGNVVSNVGGSFNNGPSMSLYDNRQSSIEGVYAVADVTDIRETPQEVLSLYRMHSPKSSRTRRLPTNSDFNYDYDYRPSLPDKPHVVFV